MNLNTCPFPEGQPMEAFQGLARDPHKTIHQMQRSLKLATEVRWIVIRTIFATLHEADHR